MDNEGDREARVIKISADDFNKKRIPVDINRETVILIKAGNKGASDDQK